MSEIMFIHCQTFARKPNRAGQCIAQVIGEGLRSGGYHAHVAAPEAPTPIFGDPSVFERMHDDHVAQRRTRAIKNGHVSKRAIRTDRHTLFTIVASYPVPVDEVKTSPEETARFRAWADLTLAWVQDQYGSQLRVAFAHLDEPYPHIHFWLLADNPDADATLLHPGKAKKVETEHRLKSEGIPPREAVRSGNRELKAAMRNWLDDYHRKVGARLGLHRDGPRRRRLSRSQYQAEQAMLAHHHQLDKDRGRLQQEVTVLREVRSAAVAEIKDLEAKAVIMLEEQRLLDQTATEFIARAKEHQQRMRARAEQVKAAGPMLDAVVREIEERTISFDPEVGWRVRDPAPLQAAGIVWKKLSPAIRRLVDMVEAADEGRWTADPLEPAANGLAAPPQFPDHGGKPAQF